MGRQVSLEPGLAAKLASMAGRGKGSGVLVGTVMEDHHHVLFVAETPSEDEEQQEVEEEEGKAAPAPPPREVDVSWMTEHQRQVLRLLPGVSLFTS